MRMWLVNPDMLCTKHLLGEHFEIHKAIGNLRKGRIWAESLTDKGFLEPQNALKRHNSLVKEMKQRGFNHNSPLNTKGVKLPIGKVDIQKSINDLLERCDKCKERVK